MFYTQCQLPLRNLFFFLGTSKMTHASTIFTVISAVIGSCGVIFNLLLCLMFFKNPQLLDAPNIFIMNMSLGGFIQSVVATPLLVLSNSRGEWPFGDAACNGYGFTVTFFGLSSMMHLTAVSYERYTTFCRLLDGNNGAAQFSKKKATVFSILLWCYSFFWSLMPITGWSNYIPEGIETCCAIDWRSQEPTHVSYDFCLLFMCYIIPIAMTVTCYYKSYKAFYQHAQQNNWNNNNMHDIQDTLAKERKMATVTVSMTTGYLVAWTPYLIYAILANAKPSLITGLAASIPAYIAKSSFCYNPLIYAFVDEKIREKLMETFFCKTSQVHPHPTLALAEVD